MFHGAQIKIYTYGNVYIAAWDYSTFADLVLINTPILAVIYDKHCSSLKFMGCMYMYTLSQSTRGLYIGRISPTYWFAIDCIS